MKYAYIERKLNSCHSWREAIPSTANQNQWSPQNRLDNWPSTCRSPGFQHREQLTPHIAYSFSNYLLLENLDKNFENYAYWEQLDLDETQILGKRLIVDGHLQFASHAIVLFRSEESAIANMVTIAGRTMFGKEITAFHIETWLSAIAEVETYLMQREPDYSQETKVFVSHSDAHNVSRDRKDYFRELFSCFGIEKKFYFLDNTVALSSPGLYVSFNFFSEAFAAVLALDNVPVHFYGTCYKVNLERSLRLHIYTLKARYLRYSLGPRVRIPWKTNGDENNYLPNVSYNFSRYLLIQNLDTSVATHQIWETLCIPPDVMTMKRVYVDPHDQSSSLAVIVFADCHEAAKEALRLHGKFLSGKQIKATILQIFLEYIMKLEIYTLYWNEDYKHASSLFVYNQNNQFFPEQVHNLNNFFSRLGTVRGINFFDYHPAFPYPSVGVHFQFLSEAFASQIAMHHVERESPEDCYILSIDKNVYSEMIKMQAHITDIQRPL